MLLVTERVIYSIPLTLLHVRFALYVMTIGVNGSIDRRRSVILLIVIVSRSVIGRRVLGRNGRSRATATVST